LETVIFMNISLGKVTLAVDDGNCVDI